MTQGKNPMAFFWGATKKKKKRKAGPPAVEMLRSVQPKKRKASYRPEKGNWCTYLLYVYTYLILRSTFLCKGCVRYGMPGMLWGTLGTVLQRFIVIRNQGVGKNAYIPPFFTHRSRS